MRKNFCVTQRKGALWTPTQKNNTEAVSAFWNRVADSYSEVSGAGHHQLGAEILHNSLFGQVLCVGGLWVNAQVDTSRYNVTILDVSEKMLEKYASKGVSTILGDACDMKVASHSYDHVVFPLVLHHLTGNGGRDARFFARRALMEAHRVLKKSGKIWIKEVVVSNTFYGVELGMAPITRRILHVYDIPLVVLHSLSFWRSALRETGFENVTVRPCDASRGHWNAMIPPIIGLPWLKIPRFLVPVKNVLLSGSSQRAASHDEDDLPLHVP